LCRKVLKISIFINLLTEFIDRKMTEGDIDPNFNVFLGSETGILKGVYFGQETPKLKNLHDFSGGRRFPEITFMSWADEDDHQKNLLVAYKNHAVKIYNRKLHAFTQGVQLDVGEGSIVGIHCHESNYVVGVDSGKVLFWDFIEDRSKLEIQSGQHLAKIRQCPSHKSVFATGGKENDLKIWDLAAPNPSLPIFKAKNIPHDSLDLRVPVWVEDLTFLPQSQDLVSICSRYGDVRLYDSKVDNKGRPVINMKFADHPLMAISTTRNDRQVIVGSAQGRMGLVDLRNGKVVHNFVGSVGGIRSISAHPSGPYFVSCGLDRHLYLHHLDERKCLKKLYLKSLLNCVLMSDDFSLDDSSKATEADSTVWQNISADLITGADTLPLSPKKKLKRVH